MKKLEMKYLEIWVGGDNCIDYDQKDFVLKNPYRASITVGLGYEDEDALTYYQFNIYSSREEINVEDDPFAVISETLTPDKLSKIINDKVEMANRSTAPLREAAKYMAWEYEHEILMNPDDDEGENGDY